MPSAPSVQDPSQESYISTSSNWSPSSSTFRDNGCELHFACRRRIFPITHWKTFMTDQPKTTQVLLSPIEAKLLSIAHANKSGPQTLDLALRADEVAVLAARLSSHLTLISMLARGAEMAFMSQIQGDHAHVKQMLMEMQILATSHLSVDDEVVPPPAVRPRPTAVPDAPPTAVYDGPAQDTNVTHVDFRNKQRTTPPPER